MVRAAAVGRCAAGRALLAVSVDDAGSPVHVGVHLTIDAQSARWFVRRVGTVAPRARVLVLTAQGRPRPAVLVEGTGRVRPDVALEPGEIPAAGLLVLELAALRDARPALPWRRLTGPAAGGPVGVRVDRIDLSTRPSLMDDRVLDWRSLPAGLAAWDEQLLLPRVTPPAGPGTPGAGWGRPTRAVPKGRSPIG